jgi:predicted Rossmann fold nucleotide-binding protein DprA/Smf involved in DNA uptake
LPQQRSLFPELSEEEERIYDLIAAFDTLSIDQLQDSAGMRSSLLAAILLSLELKGVLHVLPGKAYAVIPTQGKL